MTDSSLIFYSFNFDHKVSSHYYMGVKLFFIWSGRYKDNFISIILLYVFIYRNSFCSYIKVEFQGELIVSI